MGNWFPPNGESPLGSDPNSSGLYQDWDNNQSINLYLPSTVSSVEGGLHYCEVPDAAGIVQRLYVGVYTMLNEGKLIS